MREHLHGYQVYGSSHDCIYSADPNFTRQYCELCSVTTKHGAKPARHTSSPHVEHTELENVLEESAMREHSPSASHVANPLLGSKLVRLQLQLHDHDWLAGPTHTRFCRHDVSPQAPSLCRSLARFFKGPTAPSPAACTRSCAVSPALGATAEAGAAAGAAAAAVLCAGEGLAATETDEELRWRVLVEISTPMVEPSSKSCSSLLSSRTPLPLLDLPAPSAASAADASSRRHEASSCSASSCAEAASPRRCRFAATPLRASSQSAPSASSALASASASPSSAPASAAPLRAFASASALSCALRLDLSAAPSSLPRLGRDDSVPSRSPHAASSPSSSDSVLDAASASAATRLRAPPPLRPLLSALTPAPLSCGRDASRFTSASRRAPLPLSPST
mmetsp:Transcript_58747/g.127605  ORF Transcript_58747/g.127605 Transcript_58747/m.127605 type:complete len:393 (-) Transcript_58747:961-2139(-)